MDCTSILTSAVRKLSRLLYALGKASLQNEAMARPPGACSAIWVLSTTGIWTSARQSFARIVETLRAGTTIEIRPLADVMAEAQQAAENAQ